jgi:uncharacterized protein YdiU (UPF0061 family)
MQHLHSHTYTSDFVDAFAGDHSGDLRPRQTPSVLYSKANPTPVSNPRLLAWSEDLARELGLATPDEEDVKILAGNLVAPTMQPYAACYAGHQFGNWAGQLGDGRAITLGELIAPDGHTRELQLKGAGPTPYSRRADGRAVLRSSLREYLLSEAMHYLGVPTTRALALVDTGDEVLRDMFYNGNAAYEPGAIVMRVAPSFLRFGNFEMPAARQETDNLRKLVDWTIGRFYPHLQGENHILRWFAEVTQRTAHLMAEWMRVGFVHGVMNTDNMSILGLTIDYGPFSFVDDYDPNFTPNTTDLPGRRYAFAKQPSVGYWNLGCLASAIMPLVPDRNGLLAVLKGYEEIYWRAYYSMMGNKLGLDEVRPADVELVTGLEQTLSSLKPDMTIFYQLLAELPAGLNREDEVVNHFRDSLYREPMRNQREALQAIIKTYGERMEANAISRDEARERMRRANPRFIPRNYLLHQAIEELATGEDSLFRKLQAAIKTPYSRDFDEFFIRRPDWAGRKAGCSMLSCSS